MEHTRGMRYSPGISTSAVAREKLLKNLHFSSSRKDLNKSIQVAILNEEYATFSYFCKDLVLVSSILTHFFNLAIRECSFKAPGELQ